MIVWTARLEDGVRNLQKTEGERGGDTHRLTHIAAHLILIQILIPTLQTRILRVLVQSLMTPVLPVMEGAVRGRDPLKSLSGCQKSAVGTKREVNIMGNQDASLDSEYMIHSLYIMASLSFMYFAS